MGQKTAGALIKRWKTIESLYENIDGAELSKGVYNKLINGREDAIRSKWLATICLDVPVDYDIENYKISERNDEKLSDLLTELEMAKLMQKLGIEPSEKRASEKTVRAVDVKTQLKDIDEEILGGFLKMNSICYLFDGKAFKSAQRLDDENFIIYFTENKEYITCLLYTSPSPRD